MLQFILAATLACPPVSAGYGYQQTYGYAAPVYQTKIAYVATPYVAPTYQQTYQAPYNASLVGDYLRAEEQHKQQAEQNARIDTLIKLMTAQAQQPAPQPQPQFSAPPPQYATPQYAPQAPAKVPPPTFQAPPPTPQFPMADAPPPPPVPTKPSPSFGDSSWGTSAAAGSPLPVLTSIMGNHRCAACHSSETYASKGGGIRFYEVDGSPSLANILEHKDEVLDDVMSGRMPKGGPPLQPNEVMAVYQAIRAASNGLQASSGFGR